MDGSQFVAKRVRIFGLQKAPALNGRLGTAVSYNTDAGRYAVAVDGGESVRVKPANLELAPASGGGGGGWVAAPARAAAKTAPVAEDSWELLECARYGEEEELQQLLDAGVPVDFADDGGNTALHKAAANGHAGAVERLLAAGAAFLPNESGNMPLHWGVQQGHLEVVKALLLRSDADVLVQNSFGRSVVTEAFEKAEAQVVEAVLQHSSAQGLEPAADGEGGEEWEMSGEATHVFRLTKGLTKGLKGTEQGGEDTGEEKGEEKGEVVRIRELAQLGGDEHYSSVLGATAATDRTGLQLWGAALVLSHWLLEARDRISTRSVCELGAGCGLCGIVAAKLCGAGPTLLTDLAPPSMDNLRHNLALNGLEAPQAEAATLDWFEPATWPAPHDVLLGSDLVYGADTVPHLRKVVETLVAPGGVFVHVAPEGGEGRQGGQQFIDAMGEAGWECQQSAVPPAYLRNVLDDGSDEEFELLFAELKTRTYTLYCYSRAAAAPTSA